jgi:hypothetical protein
MTTIIAALPNFYLATFPEDGSPYEQRAIIGWKLDANDMPMAITLEGMARDTSKDVIKCPDESFLFVGAHWCAYRCEDEQAAYEYAEKIAADARALADPEAEAHVAESEATQPRTLFR